MSGSFTATYTLSGAATGSITLTIGTTPNGSGSFPITGIAGTFNGAAITGLVAPGGLGGNDNDAFAAGSAVAGVFDGVDFNGFSFTVTGGAAFNLFAFTGPSIHIFTGSTQTAPAVSFSSDVPCFLRGTRIRAESGEIAVEHLTIGDLVWTAGGELRQVRWIGRRRYLRHKLVSPFWPRIAPVRIRRDALGPGCPSRDLLVSPEHSLFLQGHLINAKNLVNGRSIAPDLSIGDVEYFHIELDRHAVIFAENAAAETYLDNGNAAQFDNAAERIGACRRGLPAPLEAWCAANAWGAHPVLAEVRTAIARRARGGLRAAA